MTTLFRLRLGFLVTAIVLVAGLTVWGVQHSWRRIHELENKLTRSHLETFRLADDFQQRLLRLNNSMMRFAARLARHRKIPGPNAHVRSRAYENSSNGGTLCRGATPLRRIFGGKRPEL